MSIKNREVFDAKVDGEKVEFAVLKPTQKQQDEAQKVYMRKYRELIENGDCLIRIQLDKVMRDRHLWDDEKEKEYGELQQRLIKNGRRITEGGFKKKEAYDLALIMRKDRDRLVDLVSIKNTLDVNTAESQAENYRFHYLVSACTVYNKNDELVFDDLEDYLSRVDEEYSIKAAQTLFKIMHNLDLLESRAKLPENKFLKKFSYVNDNLQLIDNQKRLINEDGKHIDENGRFIKWLDDKDFVFVDMNGNEVDVDGNYVVEEKPFLDDEGEPIE